MAIHSSTTGIARSAQSSLKTLTASAAKVAQMFSVVALALLLFVGAAHAQNQSQPCSSDGLSYCLFVSNFSGQNVELCRDDGKICNTSFTQAGTGAGEGVACLAGSANLLYTANYRSYAIYVFDLINGGKPKGHTQSFNPSGSNGIASLNANGNGSLVYAGEYQDNTILGLVPVSPASGWLMQMYQVSNGKPPVVNSHDAFVGPNGNVFATQNAPPDNSGIQEYLPNLTFLQQILPGITFGTPCATFSDGNQHCWKNLAGMAWDNATPPNLWVSSNARNAKGAADDGIFEFDSNGNPLNFAPDAGEKPIGVAVAPANSVNAGDIIVAEYTGGDVIKIDPVHGCNGKLGAPGICTSTVLINSTQFGSGSPKYPVYFDSCPNPDLEGHIEICKQSDLSHPVNGIFDFTVTAPYFSTGEISVPVGYCSGPVEVPAADPHGVVTVKETPVLGDLVSNVTAYSYDQYGFKIDELKSWTLPELHADVYVVPGDVDLETVATFTNYAAPKGQLKICKIAGKDVPIGTPFTFTVQTPGLFGEPYVIPAGPADQGGYCQLAGTYAANTPLLVWEQPFLNDPHYQVSNITVSPADRGSNYDYTLQSVIATIADGITEVDFTNTAKATTAQCPLAGGLYSDGPVNAGLGAFPINFGILTSDSFGLGSSGTTVTGFCFAAWLYPGDTMESVDWSITSGKLNSGSLYGSGKATAGSNLSCTLSCSANQIIGPPQFPPPSNRACGVALSGKPSGAFNVYACTVSNLNVAALPSGTTLWLNLQNATVPSGDPVFWDQNNGVGFSGYGGPSSAFDALDGPILPESFVIYGH